MNHYTKGEYVEYCLRQFSVKIGPRPAGSLANRQAADFIANEMKLIGLDVALQNNPCPDWQATFCELSTAGKTINSVANTYSPPCDIEGELVPLLSVGDIQNRDLTDKIALIYGDITRTAFLPRNFDRCYYAVEEQDQLLELLERNKPGAIITINHYDGPRPVVLEDANLIIPSITVSKDDGIYLIERIGANAKIKIESVRKESACCNVIGRHNKNGKKRMVVCAHYDTKHGTPGAMDNAAGVSTLLLLAWLLKGLKTNIDIEFVAFGGEDSWWPCDAFYLEEYPQDNIVAAINIDGIGMKESNTAIAFFEGPEWLRAEVMKVAKKHGEFIQQQFYAGDHCLFWTRGIPTLALTSSKVMDCLGTIIHTENDTMDVLDNELIKQNAALLYDVVLMMSALAV